MDQLARESLLSIWISARFYIGSPSLDCGDKARSIGVRSGGGIPVLTEEVNEV